MSPLSRLARAGTAIAVTALLVFSGTAAARAVTVIDTTSNIAFDLAPFGQNGTPTYGQTVTAPAGETRLESFSFDLNRGAGIVVRGQVYAWDAAAHRPSGEALFTSAPQTIVPGSSGRQTVLVDTGTTPVVAGREYVLLLTTVLDTQAADLSSASWAIGDDAYPGGYAVYSNEGTLQGMNSSFDGILDDYDFAFTASFATSAVITSLSPSSGPDGTPVTITGSRFTGATSVLFGGVAATSFTVDSATQIRAVAPAGTNGPVDVTVVTAEGTSTVTAAGVFTYANPTLTALSPTSGRATGGTAVTISGTNLSGASAVTFGGAPATSFTAVSSTQITAVAPAGVAGTTVDVAVTTPSGTTAASAASAFAFVAAPVVTSIDPATAALGGSTVTITGTDFTNVTAVSFGDEPATSFTVNSGTQITAVAPGQAAGTVDVVVTTAYGTSPAVAASEYTYVDAPVVTGLSATTSALAGGQAITITGTDLGTATGVDFGDTPATDVTVVSNTEITAVVPSRAVGTVDVVVTTAYGLSLANTSSAFRYVAAPVVADLSSDSGRTSGDYEITITGTDLGTATGVVFGAVAATDVTVVSDTELTVVVPAQAAGSVDVTVTTAYGTSAANADSAFLYVDAPVVDGLSFTESALAGGETVTITGTDLGTATGVDFGDVAATNVTVVSDTEITAVVPAQAAGSVDVTVTTDYGTSAANADSAFRYVAAPVVAELSFAKSALVGGRTLTITGTDLGAATSVVFGDVAATDVTVVSDTEITAVVPAQIAGTVDVVVTTAFGTSAATADSAFAYIAAPVVTGLSERSGSTVGGYAVTITGTDLADTTAVSFGGVAAARFTVLSDTEISAIVAAGSAGVADVVVTTPYGVSAASAASEFVLVAPASVPAAIAETLALTGAETAGALAGALALLLAGLAAFVVSRRRRA